MADRRRTFGPVVLLGLAGAGLAAYAGSRNWISPHTATTDDLTSPVTTSLALVVLAAWGVVLVTRGWVRRAVAVLGGVAALGPVPAMWGSTHQLLTGHAGSHVTGWPWLAAASCAISAAMCALAVMWASSWPEMGARYDAPKPSSALENDDHAGLWRQLSEGRDPTDDENA